MKKLKFKIEDNGQTRNRKKTILKRNPWASVEIFLDASMQKNGVSEKTIHGLLERIDEHNNNNAIYGSKEVRYPFGPGMYTQFYRLQEIHILTADEGHLYWLYNELNRYGIIYNTHHACDHGGKLPAELRTDKNPSWIK